MGVDPEAAFSLAQFSVGMLSIWSITKMSTGALLLMSSSPSYSSKAVKMEGAASSVAAFADSSRSGVN